MAIQDYRPQTTAPGPASVRELSIERAGDSRGAQALGNAITGVALDLEGARQEVEVNDARLKLTEGLGALNASLTQDMDFATMRERYGSTLNELQKDVLGTVRTPAQKRRVELEFAQSRIAAEANIYRRQNDLEGGHVRATLARNLRASANMIPTAGSPQEQDLIYDRTMAAIGDAEAAGYLTPEAAESARQGFDGDISLGLVLDQINTDPAAASIVLQEPGAFGLDEVDRQRHLATATRAAEQLDRATTSRLERELDTARGVLVRGGVVDPDDLDRLREEVTDTAFAPLLEGALLASQQLGNFYAAGAAERAALIERTRAEGISVTDASVDGAFLSTLEAIDAAATREIATDPIAYAQAAGVVGAGPLDLGDQASVNERMGLVRELQENYGAGNFILTKAERAQFKEIANSGEVDDQLAFVVATIEGFGPGASAVFKEIDGLDPVVRRAGDLVFETGETEVAQIILAGRKAMAAGDELRVPPEDALAVFEETLSGALGAQPGRREEAIEAVKAYYAQMAPGRVALTDLRSQTDLLAEGLQRVMGGVQLGGETYGGLQDVNGLRVRLPSTLNRAAVQELMRDAGPEHWQAGSLSGNLPHEGDTPVTPQNAVLMWVEGSTYRLGVKSRRGEIEWFQDPDTSNGFFYVDLEEMGAAFLKAPSVPARPAAPDDAIMQGFVE